MGVRLCVLVFGVLAGSTAIAQPARKRVSYKLELKPWAELPNGNIAAAKGKTTPIGDQFFVENIGVLQPVTVTVLSNKGDRVKVFLGKDTWEERLREAETGDDGKAILKLRTQGEVRITVLADGDPKPYGLLVWVGAEVKPDFEPVTMSMREYIAKQGGGGKGASVAKLAVAGGVLAALAVIVVIVIRKRGKR